MEKKGKLARDQRTLSSLMDFDSDNSKSNQDQSSYGESGTSGSELTHMRGAKIFSVAEITKQIKKLIENNQSFNNIWVRGEISNFTHHGSGHMYFDIKDEKSVIPCAMFKADNQHLKFKPDHGMKILGYGSIGIYIPHGKYQFILTDMLPDGLGALHLAYLQLKDKLSKEGLFALEHKKPIPQVPRTIGVVTSPTGAAIRDIIRVATRRFKGVKILLAPSKVQGENAADELIKALNMLQNEGSADVIILGRGGGSLEDLWAFNEEPVARAVFEATIPIISAVGHETDFTISDFVADKRAPTPSAAAEIAVPDMAEISQIISRNIRQIRQNLEAKINNYKLHLNRLLESPVITRPTDTVNQHRQNLDNLISKFTSNISNYYKLKQSYFSSIQGKLTALNPKAILNRGYSITLKLPEQRLISSIESLEKKDKIKLILKDGAVKCEVEDKIGDTQQEENDNINDKKKNNNG